jgi:hypothetical protein
MAATALAPAPPPVIHEEFCLPRPDATEPRIETYPVTGDGPGGIPRTLTVTRCIECGAARYMARTEPAPTHWRST